MAQSTIKSPFRDKVIQLTVDNTKITQGSIYCITRNGWCYIHLRDLRFASDGDSQLIISGCPKTIYQANGILTSESSSTSLNNDVFWINPDSTNILCHIGTGNHEKRHWVVFAYPYAI